MKHSPNDPEVRAAYNALAKETIEQYKAFLDAGYVVEINKTNHTLTLKRLLIKN